MLIEAIYNGHWLPLRLLLPLLHEHGGAKRHDVLAQPAPFLLPDGYC